MRAGRVAAISEERKGVSTMNIIVRPDLDASILQVRIGNEAIGGDLKDDVVSRNIVESGRR